MVINKISLSGASVNFNTQVFFDTEGKYELKKEDSGSIELEALELYVIYNANGYL